MQFVKRFISKKGKWNNCVLYLDEVDISVWSKRSNRLKRRENFGRVFSKVESYNLTSGWMKCMCRGSETDFLPEYSTENPSNIVEWLSQPRKVYRKIPCGRVAKRYTPRSLLLIQIKPGSNWAKSWLIFQLIHFRQLFYKQRTGKTQI